MKLTDFEEEIKGYYEKIWSDPSKIKRTGQGVFLGWHYGFYEKGIKNISDAMLNMNNYVDRLLTLNKSSSKDILDCGSGIGHTSIFLAEKYPKCSFYGITLTKYELEIAEKLKKESCVGNLLFKHGSYMDSNYPDNFFDKIFALESVICAPDKKKLLDEMHRILKPNGVLIIIDTFPKQYKLNSLTINTDNYWYQRNHSRDVLLNYYMITSDFISYLKSGKFKDIKIQNLIKTGNVKKIHLFGFLFYRIYPSLLSNIKKIRKKKKSMIFNLICPFTFIILFIYKILLIVYSRPGYFSIKAIKK